MVAVDEIYGNGMVIQRGKPVVIKGNTDGPEHIRIDFSGQSAEFDADGKWSIELREIAYYAGPYSMVITGYENRIIIKNIYIGEVWFALGQSNMQFRLREEAEYAGLLTNYHNQNIHIFRPLPKGAPTYDYDGFGWICDTKNMCGKMSAVAYYFACALSRALHCPVGIIDCSMGSTSAACWMSRESVLHCKPAQNVRQDADNDYPPSALYDAMLEKVELCKAAGVIYYQGESDIACRCNYGSMLERLIEDWRCRQGEAIPFIEVLLPGFAYHGKRRGTEWAQIRREQIALTHRLKKVYLVNTINEGELSDIHPKRKRGIGELLARAAMESTYQHTTHFGAPEVISCEWNENSVRLGFSHSAALRTEDEEQEAVFEAAGEDKKFYDADYVIQGAEIILSCRKVAVICYVRIGYRNYCRMNIVNEYGIPLLPYSGMKEVWPG